MIIFFKEFVIFYVLMHIIITNKTRIFSSIITPTISSTYVRTYTQVSQEVNI